MQTTANETSQQKEHKDSLLHPHKMPPTACGRQQLGRQDGPVPASPLGKSPASSSREKLWELAEISPTPAQSMTRRRPLGGGRVPACLKHQQRRRHRAGDNLQHRAGSAALCSGGDSHQRALQGCTGVAEPSIPTRFFFLCNPNPARCVAKQPQSRVQGEGCPASESPATLPFSPPRTALPARSRQGWVSHSWVIHSPAGRNAFLDPHSWARARGARPLIPAESLRPSELLHAGTGLPRRSWPGEHCNSAA